MSNAIFKVPEPINEPILSYTSGSKERKELKAELKRLQETEIEVPLIIGGKEVKTGNMGEMRVPHNHQKLLGKFHKAGKEEVKMAVEAYKRRGNLGR